MTIEDSVKTTQPLAKVILPPFASPVELAVLTAELARIGLSDPNNIRNIWNPYKCPSILLPFLAFAVSVDVWDNSWSDAQKRKVIAASPIVHKLKGTRGAIDKALSAFDIDSEVVEWWQDDSRRGTFRINMFYYDGGPIFDAKLQQQAYLSVVAAKPKARVFAARAIITARANCFIGAFTRQNFVTIAHPFQFDGQVVRAGNKIGVISAQFLTITAHNKQ